MRSKHFWGMVGGGAAAFIFFALICFGRTLVRNEGVFDITGGVKIAFLCLGILVGCAASMAGALAADDNKC